MTRISKVKVASVGLLIMAIIVVVAISNYWQSKSLRIGLNKSEALEIIRDMGYVPNHVQFIDLLNDRGSVEVYAPAPWGQQSNRSLIIVHWKRTGDTLVANAIARVDNVPAGQSLTIDEISKSLEESEK